jgi:hypothetical protein
MKKLINNPDHFESLDGRLEDEDTGVEAVGPASVRRGRKLVAVKELIAVLQNLKQGPMLQF